MPMLLPGCGKSSTGLIGQVGLLSVSRWLRMQPEGGGSAACHCRRPGILVLVNDVDWELRCEEEQLPL